MSLPPDPHDDDLAEPPAPPPPAPGEAPVAAAPGPPPSPAYAPRPSPTAPAAPVADAPAAPTEARGGRGRLGLLLAGVVVVIVVAGGIVIASGDDGDTAAPADAEVAAAGDVSPVELAEEFFAAVAQGDCGGMIERMTPESYGSGGLTATEAVAECRADAAGTAAVAAADFDDIELVSEDGDSAVVRVTVTVDGVERERELPLRQVDDRWLMHLDTSLVAAAG